ncbi:GAF domain-containing protein [Leptolyngbya sp. FACHB-16]|nr:GAF domain-containing protein [Leptolyngbya sp. FACHB-8]MBD2156628.1 GAF domain-containing protein [Leptolyngbya sp. FACHB-16]
MKGIFGSEPDSLIDLQIYDGTEPNPEALLHQSQSHHPPDKSNYRPRFVATSTIDIAGRPWTITYSSRPTFDATSSISLLPYVAIGGTIISLILFGVTQAQMEAQMEAEQSAAELRKSEQKLKNAHDELENRVNERTAELAESNRVLQDEIVARQKAQEALQQSLAFEALLKRITDRVRDSLDEQHILAGVVKELADGLKVATCNTGLYDLNENTSTICAEHTTSLPSILHQTVRMADFPEGYQQLLSGQPLQVCLINSGAQRGSATVLAYPIFDDRGVLGDLWLFRSSDDGFNTLEIRLVEQVATQCAIALRQARLYDAAQAQVKALEKVNWLKDDFLSTVSHELRTPVSNMKLSIRMLDIALTQGEPLNGNRQKVERYLQILQGECQREIDLINDLLDLQRLVSGERVLNLQTVHPEVWLNQLIKPFQARAQVRQQTLNLHLPTQDLPPLVADIASLERVISELLNNACKYTPPGETMTLQVQSYTGQMQFSLSNSGVEIPAHELPRIFDKFYRIPNADPWKQGGTGLGLALVQRLVEHMGGRIDAKSDWGETTFTVIIPNQVVLDRV